MIYVISQIIFHQFKIFSYSIYLFILYINLIQIIKCTKLFNMKIFYLFFSFLLSFLVSSAQKKGMDYISFKSAEKNLLQKERLIWTGNDNLILYPLEFFDIAVFTGDYGGAAGAEVVTFKLLNNNQNDDQITFFADECEPADGLQYFIFRFKTYDKPLVRKIMKGRKYKIIYSYRRDDLIHRMKNGSDVAELEDTQEGFEIIDIVPYEEKFARQTRVSSKKY